jgi:YD repeat-containing protein
VSQPLSPNAASLGKYVEMPVSYYSGIPEIGIPLCVLQTKDFSVPVTLSYHASGVKCREIPGWVGAGFSLNAGGVITRIVRGLPGPALWGITPPYPDARKMPNVDAEFSTGKLDTEGDEYYFNFMGFSGNFIFGQDGKIMMKEVNNLYGEFASDKFKFIDGNGLEYYFDVAETNTGGAYPYFSAWYLTKIRQPFKNEQIEFNYESEGSNTYRMNYYPTDYYEIFRYEDRSPQNGWGNPACDPTHAVGAVSEQTKTNNLLLKSIIHKTDTIKFYRNNSARTDVYKIRLDSIKLFSGTQMINRTRFAYTYSDSTTDSLAKKMLLDSLNINDEPAYRFSYFGAYMGKKMPGVNSRGEDFWGYYNGEEQMLFADDQRFLLRFKYLHGTGVTLGSIANSSFKNPDFKYARIGALKSISYPTGGKTEFEYEGNDYAYPVFPEESSSMAMDSLRQTRCPSGYPPNLAKTAEFILHHDQTVNLEVKLGMAGYINTWTDYQNYVYMGGFGAPAMARIYKYNETTGAFDLLDDWSFNAVTAVGGIGAPNPGIGFGFVKPKGTSTQNYPISLTEGRYKLETEIPGYGFSAEIKQNSEFKYKKPGRTQSGNTYYVYNAGGIRIKKIKFTSPVNSSSFEKNYDYSYKGITSGVFEVPFFNLTSKLYWGEMRIKYGQGPQGEDVVIGPQICTFFLLNQNNLVPLGNGKGGVVGYAQVTESMNDGRKRVMQFTNGYSDGIQDPLFDGIQDEYFYTALSDLMVFERAGNNNSSLRGRMKKAWSMDASGKKISQEAHRFAFLPSGVPGNSFLYLRVNPFSGPVNPGNNYGTTWASYSFTQNMIAPSIDSAWYFNGTDTLKQMTKYTYNNTRFINPSKVTSVNSDGDTTITNFKYPYDYTISGTSSLAFSKGIKNLQDKHVIAVPVETYVEKKPASGTAKTVSAQLASFKVDIPAADTVYSLINTTGLSDFVPANFTVSTAAKDSRYQRQLLFNKYDTYGNVVEQRKEGDVKEVLVWGYKKRYIVARVLSSDYNTVMALVDTAIINDPPSDAIMRTELNKIRTGLAITQPKAKVTSYTYAILRGMTSMTDARGETVYYEYDTFGRLKRAKDADGQIVENQWYHYKP